jgi:hypothetical protein
MKLRLYFTTVLAISAPCSFVAAQSAPPEAATEPTSVASDGAGPRATSDTAMASRYDEEDAMIAAAIAEQEASATRIGASIGVEAVRSFRTVNAGGLGASIAFTIKSEHPKAVGQVGFNGWPTSLYRGPEVAADRLKAWEIFLAMTLYPIELGPVDLGAYVLLSAQSIVTSVAERGALGVSAQWSFDRNWALRYQLGCTADANFISAGLVSSLAVDVVVPYI